MKSDNIYSANIICAGGGYSRLENMAKKKAKKKK
jgi:hypothetical protein